ncbi:hypothetical protein [Pseudomonas chlororaphis]|uniref:hypothetical protein n=1 Tax=Pseudomonas chlororaphis TaxID=587753 RepID=UPI0023674FA9|nr:hypothetical protein [Pseudomonas chlororaphis]WDH37903.1 hypothetical protein PUP62_14070 [Pseudomonas chlororaphis]WDH43990.1 hypothetical protein PUP51_14075 [Pseudomonas chlororaphis]
MRDSVRVAWITAALTGLFTIAASLATYWLTNKAPEMVYTLAGGPSFSTPDGVKRIFVLEINNSGSKEIKNTYVQLALPNGEFSEVAADATAGVVITQTKSKSMFELRADLLNPNDTIKLSFLTAQQTDSSEPKITVRAPGLNAIDASGKSKTSTSSYLFGIFTLIAVLAQLLSSFVTTKYKKNKSENSGTRLDGNELSAFIFGACGLQSEISSIRKSFRGVADLLGALSHKSERYKIQTLVALKAHVLIKHMHVASLAVFRYNISLLSESPISDAEFNELRSKAIEEGDDTVMWRVTCSDFIRCEIQKYAHALSDEDFTSLKKYFTPQP